MEILLENVKNIIFSTRMLKNMRNRNIIYTVKLSEKLFFFQISQCS